MHNKIKSTALVITLAFGLSFVSVFAATGDTNTASTGSISNVSVGEKFALKEVKVVDGKTLKVSFTKDLLEDTTMFEFLLTSKKDETKEVALTGITLTSSNELTLKTGEDLKNSEEYNFTVVFASDKEGKLIENGVDGIVTFKVPDTFTSAQLSVEQPLNGTLGNGTPSNNSTPGGEQPLNAAPENGTPSNNSTPLMDQPLNVAPETIAPENTASGDINSASGGMNPENAANDEATTELPKTGPQEILIVLVALMLGLGFMYNRRKA